MKYWLTYSSTLLSYLIFSITWISVAHTMPVLPKIIGTSVCVMVVVVIAWYRARSWKLICLLPISFFIWITVVDASIGLWFHKDIFYMSVDTWPDNWTVQIVQNGEGYAIFKALMILWSSGFLKYLK